MIDKKLFYDQFTGFENKHIAISIDMPIFYGSKYRIVYYWNSRKLDGEFNPHMNCSLIDTEKQGIEQYIVPDLIFDCIKENITTDFRLYKFLDKWVTESIMRYEGKKIK